MATTLYFRTSDPDTHLGANPARLDGTATGWSVLALSTTAGAGVATRSANTVAGATNGVELNDGLPISFISPPVSADVTITGNITANIWAAESNMSANVAINVVIDIIRANTLTTSNSNTIVQIVRSTRVTEVAVTTRAVNNFTTGMLAADYTEQTLNRGDRLRIRIFGDDAGTMGSGFSFNVGINGGTAAADGDSYVIFTENITFESAPAGSQLFLTNVHSGLSGAPTLVSDFTGADENPLSEGGNWANLNSSGNPLQRISNAVAASAGAGRSYWTPANFGPDLEAYVTFTASPTSNCGILCRIQGEGGAATWDGYQVYGTTAVTAIERVDNAITTTLIAPSVTWATGDKLGVRCEGSTIQCWRQASGSSDWNLVCSAVDSTYGSAGKIGLVAASTTMRLDDFYAATDSNLFTQKAWTSRGAGVVSYISDTDAGWVAPLLTNEWFTPQLQAFTLTGMALGNIRAKTDTAGLACSLRLEIARVDSDGTNPTVWGTWCLSTVTNGVGTLTNTERAEVFNVSGDDLAFSSGQRIRIRLYLDDPPGSAMETSNTITTYYNGTSGGASGDSYITLAQTVSEFVAEALVLEHGFVDHGNPGVL